MNGVADVVNHLLNFPESIEKFISAARTDETSENENKGVRSSTADILYTQKEYIFYLDVPGLPKSDIQVIVEDENTLVIKSNGKRKREDGEEEGCKYVRMERRTPQKLMKQPLGEAPEEIALEEKKGKMGISHHQKSKNNFDGKRCHVSKMGPTFIPVMPCGPTWQ